MKINDCPRCGSKPITDTIPAYTQINTPIKGRKEYSYVSCFECGFHINGDILDEAIAKWNNINFEHKIEL